MAFPTVSEIVNSTQFTASTTHDVDIPAGLVPGSVLLVVTICHGNESPDGFPPGFSLLEYVPASFGDGNVNIAVWGYTYKPAELPILGVERGDRSTVPGGEIILTTDTAKRSDAYAIAFAEQGIPLSHFVFAETSGGATAINPSNLAYSGSAKDVLWFVFATGIGWTPGSFPANYTLHQFDHDTADWGHAQGSAICARELNAASEDPPAFTGGAGPTSDWVAITMGVALDGP